MRPTYLQFRSPKERTPEFYSSKLTHTGHKINFEPLSLNKGKSTWGSVERFPSIERVGHTTNVFLGPGTYND